MARSEETAKTLHDPCRGFLTDLVQPGADLVYAHDSALDEHPDKLLILFTPRSSSRFIPRRLPVNLPPLGRSQDSAKRVVLPKASPLLGIIEQNASDLGPRALQNVHPFSGRDIPPFDPARTDLPRMREPSARGIAVDLRDDTASHRQAA